MNALMLLVVVSQIGPHAANPPSCLTDSSVKQLDAGWERAYLERDVEALDELLADDYVWVHTHASEIDSKESVMRRVATAKEWGMVSRVQSDVEVRRLDRTAVVTGYTVVTRNDGSTRYTFMRTYVESSGKCVLLANQTMAIPEDE